LGRKFLDGLARAAVAAAALCIAVALTLGVFLVLPLLEQVASSRKEDVELRAVDTANLPPPPPPPEEEKQKEEEQEEPPPPELADEAPPLDLSQLELALNPGFGEGIGGDFAVRLGGADSEGRKEEADSIFSMAELDQQPRVVFQPAPEYPSELRRKKVAGTAHVLFVVDKDGRVKNPIVQKSTHPLFEQPALNAVKKWRFEPGKRDGKSVQFKMRVPISFMAG
jgi:protein TonB